jgi:hypothetical protein
MFAGSETLLKLVQLHSQVCELISHLRNDSHLLLVFMTLLFKFDIFILEFLNLVEQLSDFVFIHACIDHSLTFSLRGTKISISLYSFHAMNLFHINLWNKSWN